MKSIAYIGMDVQTTNYTLCCYRVNDDRYFVGIEIKPDYREVLKYTDRVQSRMVRLQLVSSANIYPRVICRCANENHHHT